MWRGAEAELGGCLCLHCSLLAPFPISRRLLKVKVPDISLSGKGLSLRCGHQGAGSYITTVVTQPRNHTLRGLGLLIKEAQV